MTIKARYEAKFWDGQVIGVYATEADAWRAADAAAKHRSAAAEAAKAAGDVVEYGRLAANNTVCVFRYSHGWRSAVGSHGAPVSFAKSRRAKAPALTA